MNNNFKLYLEEALSEMINTIKILLYKTDPEIFDYIDFENDTIYCEPLLYAFFNNRMKLDYNINQILCGFQNDSKKYTQIKTDDKCRVYIPNIGWFITNKPNELLDYDNKKQELNISFLLEKPMFLINSNIEMLPYSIPLLKQCFYDTEKNILEVEIENISKKHLENVSKAYNLIKEYIPTQYELIEKYAPKFTVFNIDTYLRNSFADITAHGIAFYNAYQEDYDEVFFIDDIAHQTGHVIFNTLLFKPELYFKINKNTTLENIFMPDKETIVEKRDLFVIFHALYTYYTSLTCLDACLSNNVFNQRQTHEAKGRISFYIAKCYNDIKLIDDPITSDVKANEYFTERGLEIYVEIKKLWNKMYQKWYSEVGKYDMKNQPYNFTYSKFLELNPLN